MLLSKSVIMGWWVWGSNGTHSGVSRVIPDGVKYKQIKLFTFDIHWKIRCGNSSSLLRIPHYKMIYLWVEQICHRSSVLWMMSGVFLSGFIKSILVLVSIPRKSGQVNLHISQEKEVCHPLTQGINGVIHSLNHILWLTSATWTNRWMGWLGNCLPLMSGQNCE